MKKIIIFMIINTIFFIGCGDDNTSKKIAENGQNIIELVTGKTYIVKEGDKLEKTSDDAEVIIKKNTETEITTVILTQGSATITKK